MSRKIAYAGMLLAVDTVLFLMVNVFQTNTIFLLGLASLPIAIVIMNWGPKTGIAFYIASLVISFIAMANKIHWIIYVLTFGIYGLIKFIIEQDRKGGSVLEEQYIEYILKLSYANITLVVLYFIIRQFIVIPQKWYLVILFEVVFLVYDYVYSLFIDYYNEKLNKYFK